MNKNRFAHSFVFRFFSANFFLSSTPVFLIAFLALAAHLSPSFALQSTLQDKEVTYNYPSPDGKHSVVYQGSLSGPGALYLGAPEENVLILAGSFSTLPLITWADNDWVEIGLVKPPRSFSGHYYHVATRELSPAFVMPLTVHFDARTVVCLVPDGLEFRNLDSGRLQFHQVVPFPELDALLRNCSLDARFEEGGDFVLEWSCPQLNGMPGKLHRERLDAKQWSGQSPEPAS